MAVGSYAGAFFAQRYGEKTRFVSENEGVRSRISLFRCSCDTQNTVAETKLLPRVHIKDSNRCSSNIRQANDQNALLVKVFAPCVAARMKKSGQDAGQRVKAGQVRAFVRITVQTGQGKIVVLVAAVVLASDDVFDLESRH
jgi:hypothetical protein